MAGWAERVGHTGGAEGYVPTAYHEDLLSKMMQSHTAGDFSLIGGRVRGERGEADLWKEVYWGRVHYMKER